MQNTRFVSVTLSILVSFLFVYAAATAATTISTNISTEGTLTVTGTSALTGNVSTDGSLTVTNTTATSTFSTGGLAIGTSTPFGNGLLTVGTSSPLFYIDRASGNIGVGTTNPTRKLYVNGDIHIGGINRLFFDEPTGGYPAYFYNTDTTLGNTKLQGGMGRADAWQILGSGADEVGVMHIRSGDDGDEPIYIEQSSWSGSVYVRLAIGSNGNIGIGTTSPGSLLHLSQTTASDTGLRFESQSYNWIMGIDNSDGGKLKISSSTALGTSDRLIIDGSGNVGIGTSSPASQFHVSNGASATTTVEFGAQSTGAKTCFNVRDALGAATSFYFNGTTMVVEANRCR